MRPEPSPAPQGPSPRDTTRLSPALWCVVAAALFGASSPASKALLGSVGPLTLAGLLYLGAALAVLPFVFRGGSKAARRERKNVLRMGGVVLFGGVLGPVLLLIGLSRAPAASVSLWLNLETPATALLAWAFFKEHLERRGLLAVVLVTGASALLAGASGVALVPAALLVAAACLCWGLDNNLSALVDGFTPAQSTFAKGLVAGGVNLGLGLWLEGGVESGGVVGGGLGIGALCYGASLALYVRGAQHLGAVRSQMLFASAPFFGVLLSWTVAGEPMLLAQLGAAAGMAVAFVLLHGERHAHEHVHEALTHTHWHRHDDGHHEDHAHEHGHVRGWHIHEHAHRARRHAHAHRPDLHHRHAHG